MLPAEVSPFCAGSAVIVQVGLGIGSNGANKIAFTCVYDKRKTRRFGLSLNERYLLQISSDKILESLKSDCNCRSFC